MAGHKWGCMKKPWETEFLQLAAVHLEARWCVMGADIADRHGKVLHRGARTFRECSWHMLGMRDYAWEMALVCREQQKGRKNMNPIAPIIAIIIGLLTSPWHGALPWDQHNGQGFENYIVKQYGTSGPSAVTHHVGRR